MDYRILLVAPLAALVLSVGAADLRMPAGWQSFNNTNDYEIGIDPASEVAGSPSLTVRSGAPQRTGSLSVGAAHQSATGYAGQRIRFSGQVRADAARGWAGLYMGAGDLTLLGRMAMARPGAEEQLPRGAAVPAADGAWHEVSVVLDVPADAVQVDFGLVQLGEGQVWARALSFEVVGAGVAPTQTSVGFDLQAARRLLTENRAQLAKFPPQPLLNASLD